MIKARMLAVAVLALNLMSVSALAEATGPEETVKQWLAAMKAHEFTTAYKHISKGMAGNKDVEAWAKEQKYMFEASDLKIFKYEVFPGKIEGDKAKVPNILSSQDKFLNQLGADEYELYTLIKEDGTWKIDQQEIVEKGDKSEWFAKKGG
jgi:signal transduction protein with GAF and PtsI domain